MENVKLVLKMNMVIYVLVMRNCNGKGTIFGDVNVIVIQITLVIYVNIMVFKLI